jgi:hypothetical protein
LGPACQKIFHVNLEIGIGTPQIESYTSSGKSIKKAQHAVAELALEKTKFTNFKKNFTLNEPDSPSKLNYKIHSKNHITFNYSK